MRKFLPRRRKGEEESAPHAARGTSRRQLLLFFLLCIPFLLGGNYPQWWIDRGVVIQGAVTNDYGPVNQGQLKWIATKGYEEFQAKLPGGAGSNLTVLIQSFSLTNANYAPVNIGQLKNVAKPFYDRLIEVGYTNAYPWPESSTNRNDYAMANVGQVKYLFSFDLNPGAGDSDHDTLSDDFELQYFGNLAQGPNDDPDGDGFSNLQESQMGTDPTNFWSFPGALSEETIASVTNHFCIEQVMRAATERAVATGLSSSSNYFVWPSRYFNENGFVANGEDPGPYPSDCFYFFDLNATNYFGSQGVRQSQLVDNLNHKMRDYTFLYNYVNKIKGERDIVTYATTMPWVVDTVTPDNYREALAKLAQEVLKLDRIQVPAVRVELTGKFIGTPGGCPFINCVAGRACILSQYPLISYGMAYIYDDGDFHASPCHVRGSAPIPLGFESTMRIEENLTGMISSGQGCYGFLLWNVKGKIQTDLTSFSSGTAEVYLKIANIGPNVPATFNPPVVADSTYHKWTSVPVNGIWQSSIFGDIPEATFTDDVNCRADGSRAIASKFLGVEGGRHYPSLHFSVCI